MLNYFSGPFLTYSNVFEIPLKLTVDIIVKLKLTVDIIVKLLFWAISFAFNLSLWTQNKLVTSKQRTILKQCHTMKRLCMTFLGNFIRIQFEPLVSTSHKFQWGLRIKISTTNAVFNLNLQFHQVLTLKRENH